MREELAILRQELDESKDDGLQEVQQDLQKAQKAVEPDAERARLIGEWTVDTGPFSAAACCPASPAGPAPGAGRVSAGDFRDFWELPGLALLCPATDI